MKYLVLGILSCLLGAGFFSPYSCSDRSFMPEDSVADILVKLGDSPVLDKYPIKNDPRISAAIGEAIVKEGFAETPDGKKVKKQSKHFVCTSCHNVVKEDPDLAFPDPQERLEYSVEKGIPFLQGTTLYGAVNRDSYYNGDYEKKYGDLVEPARNDIREAIKLCAVECAQGRELQSWEVESVLSYLWTIDLKMNDLNLAGEESDFINEVLSGKDDSRADALAMIDSKYLKDSPATFTRPPTNRSIGYDYEGNPANGELIYEQSCMHCHKNERYSYFHLDKHKMSLRHMKRHIGGYTRHSIYQVIRWGVPVKSGKKSYMPQYPQEKMSDQMVEDLRAYFEAS